MLVDYKHCCDTINPLARAPGHFRRRFGGVTHTAYPIFYDVEPSEVRKQSGAVEITLAKHENEEVAEKLRDALKEVADLGGWELKKTANRHEAKFIKKIVEELSLELRAINFSSDEKLVGMETRIYDVLSSMGTILNDVRLITINGMGGGGKTTLARVVFDQISFQFEGKSFVENVREVSKASLSGLKSLQKQILLDVLNDQGISVSSVYDGKNMMKRWMPGKKVLLVLDDVDHMEQLEALAGETNWFKSGSRIIITTRDEQVLVAHGVKLIHNVQLLLYEEAICLFSKYAFGRVVPNQGYEELSQQVVHYAAGLPLTIKVLGSFLCGKTDLEWVDALNRLKTIPLMETQKKLEISYISLEKDYKEIFLDVACLLKGWPKARAIRALESCGYHARNGLRVLEQKSLITFKNVWHDEYVGMHDHLEEMGKSIIRRSHPDKPHKHSRLWIDKEIEEIFANDLGNAAIRYIQFNRTNLRPEIVMKGLTTMKELRFLDVSALYIGANKSECSHQNWKFNKFNALRYLCWNNCPFRSLPETFKADNLVTLEMTSSRIIRLWDGEERKVLNKLRFLDLSYSMLRTLELGLAPNLELLDLQRCSDLIDIRFPRRCQNLKYINLSYTKLRTLNIGLTPNLEELDLRECYDLEELHMAGQCQKLSSLNISHSKLRNLDLGLTPNLKYLDLKECYNLVELHMADEPLQKLVNLDRSGCLRSRSSKVQIKRDASCTQDDSSCSKDESLEVGPLAELILIASSVDDEVDVEDSILSKLDLSFTEDLPDSNCILKCLESLDLSYCSLLEKLSENFGRIKCLEELDLSYTKIKQLPESICMLKHLKSLKYKSCWLLEKLPKDLGRLECLVKLILSSTEIKDLPDSICLLKHFECLELNNFSCIKKLPEDLGQLQCLKKLSLTSAKIKYLPDSICVLKHLESLDVSYCTMLEKLPEELGRLECLEKLDLRYCKFLQDIPNSICEMKYLNRLWLYYCIQLKKLAEELERLESLEILDITRTCISHLPHILLLKGLRIFGARRLLQSRGFRSQIKTIKMKSSATWMCE